MACNPPYCNATGGWCGCNCGCCPPCPCYTSFTWTTTIPQLVNPGCSGGPSIVLVNTLSIDDSEEGGCCLQPIQTDIGNAQFYVVGSANVTLTNSIVSYSCGSYPVTWRAGLNSTYAVGNVTKFLNDCTIATVNGGPTGAPFCCPYTNVMTVKTWVTAPICPDAPPPAFTRKQMMQRAIISRMRKVKY